VNRIFGANAVKPFDNNTSRTHLINVNYSGIKFGKLIPYVYLIDNRDVPAFSSKTAGLRFNGSTPLENITILYTAEFAHQTDGFNNPTDYNVNYFHFVLGATLHDVTVKVGDEVLTGDKSSTANEAFQTPLATLHKFNGWADVFLVTPKPGIDDRYIYLGAKLTKLADIEPKLIFHHFSAEDGSQHYGNEIDFALSKEFQKRYGLKIEYADFFNTDEPDFVRTRKIWLTATAKFDA